MSNAERTPIEVAQTELARASSVDFVSAQTALKQIIEMKLWLPRFNTFAEFAIALPPAGLGVRSLEPLKVVRDALLALSKYAELTELLEKVATKPGRPVVNIAQDESFRRFYTVPTSFGARDRQLLSLKQQDPDLFAEVCDEVSTPREAAIEAGYIKADGFSERRLLAYATELETAEQAALLLRLFEALPLEAQQRFLAQLGVAVSSIAR